MRVLSVQEMETVAGGTTPTCGKPPKTKKPKCGSGKASSGKGSSAKASSGKGSSSSSKGGDCGCPPELNGDC